MQTKTIFVLFFLALDCFSIYWVFTLLHEHREEIQP